MPVSFFCGFMPSFWLSLSFVCGYIVWLRFGVGCGRLLVVATKDVVVRVRVDAATKELWVQSAGGDQLLSRWVRERCNAAVSEGVGDSPERSRVESVGSTPTTAPSRSVTVCPNVRFHRPGTFCKQCGVVA